MIKHIFLVILFASWMVAEYYSETYVQRPSSEDPIAIGYLLYRLRKRSDPKPSIPSLLLHTEIPPKYESIASQTSVLTASSTVINQPKESVNQTSIVKTSYNSSALNYSNQSMKNNTHELTAKPHKP